MASNILQSFLGDIKGSQVGKLEEFLILKYWPGINVRFFFFLQWIYSGVLGHTFFNLKSFTYSLYNI